jgi:hypothetical protein
MPDVGHRAQVSLIVAEKKQAHSSANAVEILAGAFYTRDCRRGRVDELELRVSA